MKIAKWSSLGVFSVIMVEVMLRLLLPLDVVIDGILYSSTEAYPSLWRILWVRQNQEKRQITYDFDIHDSTLGWKSKSNIRNKKVFESFVKGKTLNTNSKGLRGIKEYSYKRINKKRIAVIGDSYTFGEEVSDHETYSHLLERSLSNTEVLNFGIHGYGHDQMLLYLRKEVLKYKPDVVLLGFIESDMLRNVMSFRDFAKPVFTMNSGKLELENVPVPTPEEVLKREVWQLKIFDLFGILGTRIEWERGALIERVENLTSKLLSEIIKETRSIGAKPVFVHIPLSGMPLKTSAYDGYEQYLEEICTNEKIPCLRTRPDFLKAMKQGKKHNIEAGHWDATGHQTIASSIKRFLLRENLLQ